MMNSGTKATISFVLSFGAILVALGSVYFEFLRSISLDIAVSEDVYISNTIGGLPDIELSIALRAKGPPAKAITVGLIEVNLRNVNTENEHNLIFAEKENLPLIVNGGDVVTRSGLFISSSDIPTRIERDDKWFHRFSDLFPDQKDRIEEMRIRHREEFISTEHDYSGLDYQGQEEPNPFLGFLMDNPLIRFSVELERKEKDIKTIADLLRKVPIEKVHKFVFFMGHEYEIDIRVFDPFNTNLATHKRKFKIDGVLSQSLRDKFNKNLRIRTTLVGRT